MKPIDILTAPWAILPEKLLEIQGIYATHLRGEKIDIAALEARLGRPVANEPKPYEVVDGVALISADGVIAKRANLFSQISGGASSQLISRDVRAAVADKTVHSIVLMIDSPGGAVDGTQTLAGDIFAARESKPIVAWANGTMASAAYWFGSAADAVYISDLTTLVGSIGVVAKHMDVSGAEAQAGVKTTEIYAGKYKRVASQYGPLTDEGRKSIQDQVDYTYSVFVADVAKHRGVSEDKVVSDMAEGRVFIGQQAIDAGLVDGVSTLDALIAKLNADRAGAAQDGNPRAGVAQQTPPNLSQGNAMNREQLAAQHPQLLEAIVAEERAAGAKAERERIQAVEAALIPGYEAVIAPLKYDGKTTGGEAALAVVAEDRKVRQQAAQDMHDDAPAPARQVPPATVRQDQAAAAAAEEEKLPLEERCKAQWDRDANLRGEFASLSHFVAFSKAQAGGRVKVQSAGARG